ncbi:LamG-like jellyroll fold domain-containing protein, partial [Nonomuraea sp. NPDC046802]|uniref:LamG-like jellyroll fold domain-containing protein n=1 Tax=Nonomuraea sp. NPDC046802 TaxID=3154919 RepID=UPI0033ED16F9
MVAVVLVAALPGFVALPAPPAFAQAEGVGGMSIVAGDAVIPTQQMGSGGGAPRRAGASSLEGEQEPGRELGVEGALPLDRRPTKQAEPKSELPAGVERAERAERETAAAAYPMINDVYPDAGLLVDTTTPLLTVRATLANPGTWDTMDYTYHICEKPEEDEEGNTFPGDPPAPPKCWESEKLPSQDTWRVPAGRLEWGKPYEWWVRVEVSGGGAYTKSDRQQIVIGARQPVISSHLGERAREGQEFSPVTGNYTTSAVDAQVKVAGPPLAVGRTYNSLDGRTDGIFGAGWSTPWDAKVTAETSGTATTGLLVSYPDGRRVRFAARGDGTYQPPPGTTDSLADVEGGGWRLKDATATTYVFNAAGRLLKIADDRGRAQTLQYEAGGTFSSVTGVGGRALHFTWNGSRVATVSTDAVDGKALTWTYSYTGDNLTSVCSPAAQPNCTIYGYGDGSRYKAAVLDTEPVGYWRLGDAKYESAANLGSEGYSGQYNNVTVGQPGALEGSTDTAAGFTKSTVTLPSGMLDRVRDQASIEGWFKTTQNGMILSAGRFGYEFGATDPVLYVGTDGRLRGQLGELSSGSPYYRPITSAGPVNDGQWHHVVLTVAGERQKLYLDGQAIGELNGATYPEYRPAASVGSGDRAISWSEYPGGQTAAGAFAFKGTIDEFALYKRPLTDAEVQSHWAARVKTPSRLTQVTLPSGRIWAKNTYDQATDRLVTHTDRHGGAWQVGKPDINYSEQATEVVVTDPRNGTLTHGYDQGRGDRVVYEVDQHSYKASYDYDTGGFLAKKTDRNKNVFQWWNDKRGNPIRGKSCRTATSCQTAYAGYHENKDDELDPRNDQMLVYRDARSSSEDSNTYATTWEYNQHGEPIKQTTPATSDFPNGRSTSIAYTDGSEPAIGGGTTPAGLIASQTDARGNAWTYRYTAAGDLAEQRNPEGLLAKLSYDALGRLREKAEVSQAHPDGVKTVFTYDALGRLATQTEPGVKNEVSGVTHTKRTTHAYDPDNNKLSETISDLTGGDAERATVYTYDSHGKVETITDPEGGVVRQAWNSIGSLATVTDARGAVVDYAYNARGELATQTLKGWTGSPVNPQPAKDVEVASFIYDGEGRLLEQRDAMQRTTRFEYFKDNLLSKKIAYQAKLNGSATAKDVTLEEHTYDAVGNQIKLVAGGGKVSTESVYDAAGRLTSQTLDPGVLSRRTAFVYDASDNVVKTTRTAGGTGRAEVTEFAYNKVNQATKTTVENGAVDLVSTVTYDDRGLAVASTEPRGNADGADKDDFTTTTRYDALGRQVEVSGPQVKVDKAGTAIDARSTVRFGYDMLGVKTHETDAEGRTVTSAFDKAGRLTGQSAPSYTPPGGTAVTPTTSNAYDAAGQLVSTTDPRGYTTRFEYDKLGRQVRVTDPAPEGEAAGTWVSEYDLAGEKLASVDPTGARTQATYDD